ncbi:MAG TPA: TIGR03560 family F420-dependent LLM class oxidoreductase [Anaerolineales bacterium]|jgi:F420-dependent oxidoreductase-like protein
MDLALMIEGQDGLTWQRWQRLAQAAESLGFAGLYRSDHFTGARSPAKDSLECWLSLAWLANNTRRIEFGPLVSPVSFRHPVFLARWAKDLDALSGGRFQLGVGAGWQDREHRMYGFPLLGPKHRFDRFAEGTEVIHRLLRQSEPQFFEGDYYQLNKAVLLPRPAHQGRPPIVIGGNGRQRTLPLAARWADEWNGVFLAADEYGQRNRLLNELLEENGRGADAVQRSVMVNVTMAASQAELEAKAAARGTSLDEVRSWPAIVGTPDEIPEQLEAYRRAGAQRMMLQWLELDDLDGLRLLAETVLANFP